MSDRLAQKHALRALLADVPSLAFEDGRFTAPARKPPCCGYQACCECHGCEAKAALIAERGFTPGGEIKPPEKPSQPW